MVDADNLWRLDEARIPALERDALIVVFGIDSTPGVARIRPRRPVSSLQRPHIITTPPTLSEPGSGPQGLIVATPLPEKTDFTLGRCDTSDFQSRYRRTSQYLHDRFRNQLIDTLCFGVLSQRRPYRAPPTHDDARLVEMLVRACQPTARQRCGVDRGHCVGSD